MGRNWQRVDKTDGEVGGGGFWWWRSSRVPKHTCGDWEIKGVARLGLV